MQDCIIPCAIILKKNKEKIINVIVVVMSNEKQSSSDKIKIGFYPFTQVLNTIQDEI